MLQYWKQVLDQTDAAFMPWAKEARAHMIGFVVQSAVLFLILFLLPWLGDVGSEVRLGVAAAAAILGSALLTWLYYLVRAPYELHSAQVQANKSLAQTVAALGAQKADEDHKIAMCNLMTVLKGQAAELHSQRITEEQLPEWLKTVDEWNEVAVTFARNEFSAEMAARLSVVRFQERKVSYQVNEQHRDRVLALGRQIELLEHEMDLLKPYWRPLKAPQAKAIEAQILAVRDKLRARREKSDTSKATQH